MRFKVKAGPAQQESWNWMDVAFLIVAGILGIVCRAMMLQGRGAAFHGEKMRIIACCFDIILSMIVGFLVTEITENKKKGIGAGLMSLFSPAVILSSSVFGQLESAAAAGILLLTLWAVRKRTEISGRILGVSVVLLLLTEMGLSGWGLAGKGISLTNHFPDFYTLLGTWHDQAAGISGLIAAAFWLVCGVIWIKTYRNKTNRADIVWQGAIAGMFLALLLPGMEYHSGFIVDILMIMLIFIRPENWYLGIAWNMTSVLTMVSVMSGKEAVPETVLSTIRFVILALTTAVYISESRKAECSAVCEEKNIRNGKTDFFVSGMTKGDMLFLVFTAAAGMAARIVLFRMESYDYTHDFKAWLDVMYQNGGLRSLKMEISDYTTPYTAFLTMLTAVIPQSHEYYCLYAMKLLSGLFDIIASLLLAEIVFHMTGSRAKTRAAFAMIFFLPTVLINSAAWGQCDIIYVTFLLAFLLYVMKKKSFPAMMFLGAALSIKLQAVFVLPVLAAALLLKKVKWRHLFLLPAVYFLTMLPALLMGRSFGSLIGIYFTQAGEFAESLSMHAPNFYYLTGVSAPEVVEKTGLLLAFLLMGTIIYMVIRDEYARGSFLDDLVLAVILIIAVCCFFLPHMHERYGFLADILIVAAALKEPRRWPLAAAWNFIAVIPYLWYMTGYLAIDMKILAVAQSVVLAGLAYEMVRTWELTGRKVSTQEERQSDTGI